MEKLSFGWTKFRGAGQAVHQILDFVLGKPQHILKGSLLSG